MPEAGLTARPGGPLRGRVRAPGDKSISHRSLILGALAEGETTIEGLLEGDDVIRTAQAMGEFGATVTQGGEGRWRVAGHGRYLAPETVVDCGNSGTGVRLIMGAAAGFDMVSTFTGDPSLRSRPMIGNQPNGSCAKFCMKMPVTWPPCAVLRRSPSLLTKVSTPSACLATH